MKTIIEPFRIKMVEPIKLTTPAQREEILRRAHFNVFQIPAEEVMIDLLTDSGTSAMSSEQWAGMLRGDESYAGARSWYHFESVLRDLTGMPHILPTHQGRASERILFELICAGQERNPILRSGEQPGGQERNPILRSREPLVIPNNNHFDTTRANIEHSGAEAVDLVIDEGRAPRSRHPFKGNLDPQKLEALIERVGAARIPLCMVTVTNNSGGGQPVSLANLQEVRGICARHGIPLFLDACRFAENAYLIKQREPGHAHRSARDIARAMFDLADGATISAKKDGLVNIGGVLLMRDHALAERANNLLILTEGFVTYGGLAGRDLEAMAQGFTEVLHEDYLQYRLRSVAYLGEHLLAAGIQIVEPPGGHAVYLDAAAFCPHVPPARFPGQAVVCALYRHAGIRAVEIGSVMFGRVDPVTGAASHPPMELVRLALPRRVYTQSHIDYVIEATIEVFERRDQLRPLRILEEPAALRHFTAKFEEM
ncbi:MAG: tryptophanase [Gemmataceae bacterium]|nr:tryptophanase [Gemmataceae bacterium]MCI0739045.1 tryptophanase [Gemmataceae bacterium]